MDSACTQSYAGEANVQSGFDLYGKWEKVSTPTPPGPGEGGGDPDPDPTPDPGPSTISVTVKKKWVLDDGRTAPETVSVLLLRDGKPHRGQRLAAQMDWTE